MVLPGAVYGEIMYQTGYEVASGGRKADLFLQNDCNVSLVVDYRSCKRTKVFLQIAPTKSIFGHEFHFFALHHVMAPIRKLEDIFEDVVLEVLCVNKL